MPRLTRLELRAIAERRSQQDLLDLLPRVEDLLDELEAPSLDDEIAAASAADGDAAEQPA